MMKIGYADSFILSPGVSTYTYPTTLTDPANNSSTVTYRYDIGANVEAVKSAPAGQTYGKTSKRIYDSVGRLQKDSPNRTPGHAKKLADPSASFLMIGMK